MTRDRDFKHAVRARVAQTGERYTQARDALRRPVAGGSTPAPPLDDLLARLRSSVHGKDQVVQLFLVAAIARGHVLFEDVSGTARSLLVRSFCDETGGTLLTIRGSDETSVDELTAEADVVEIDDLVLTPDTFRSALIDVMDSAGRMVVGNFNPVLFVRRGIEGVKDFSGALADRFLFKMNMGYPSAEAELAIVNAPPEAAVPTGAFGSSLQDAAARASSMTIPDELAQRIVEVVHRTRRDDALILGASPRASRAVARAAAASAVLSGRDVVTEQDLEGLWKPALAHRLWLTPAAVESGVSIDKVVERATA